jgi:branched-chain amino acid transport system permease protein
VQYYLPPDSEVTANIVPAIPFAFVVISLIVNILRSGRVNEEEGVGGALDRAITPNGGSRLAASTDSENLYPKLNFTFPIVIFAAICILPLIFAPYWQSLMVTGVALAVVFLSYTLVTGEGGMLWLCQITFAGVGALASAQFATVHGWPIIPAVIMGGVIAGLIGVVIGLLTIRLGNLYIALVTLTFGLLMERLVFNLQDFANFGAGVAVARPEFASTDKGFIYFALAVFAIFAVLIVNLRRSTTGLALNAVRWSENASRTMGLSVITMKMLVSGLAAFVAGVGGGLYALSFKQAIPLDYATILGLVWLAVLVTFGVRSNIAALLAGLLFTFSPAFIQTVLKLEAPWSDVPILLFGLGAIALAQNPEGTVHQWAMGLQRMLHKASGGGARPVPAATAFAGRHDPRLHDDEPPPPAGATQPDGTTAEVAGS